MPRMFRHQELKWNHQIKKINDDSIMLLALAHPNTDIDHPKEILSTPRKLKKYPLCCFGTGLPFRAPNLPGGCTQFQLSRETRSWRYGPLPPSQS